MITSKNKKYQLSHRVQPPAGDFHATMVTTASCAAGGIADFDEFPLPVEEQTQERHMLLAKKSAIISFAQRTP